MKLVDNSQNPGLHGGGSVVMVPTERALWGERGN